MTEEEKEDTRLFIEAKIEMGKELIRLSEILYNSSCAIRTLLADPRSITLNSETKTAIFNALNPIAKAISSANKESCSKWTIRGPTPKLPEPK